MRAFRFLPVVLLALTPAARADDTKEFLDPTNWDGIERYWKVEGATVTGHADKDPGFNTFLCSRKPYTDFELSFKVRLKDGKGNSGVQVRSKVVDPAKHIVAGPQCDAGAQYWGSLYGEKFGGMMKASKPEMVKEKVKPADFNDYHIRVVGKRVTIKINGETFNDGEFEKMPESGIIAFQLHQGGPMTVEYTDIKFVDLGKKK